MKQLSYLFIIILPAVSFWLGRQSVRPVVETVETVRTDTIYQDRPVPVAITSRPITVNVPRLVFVERTPNIVSDTNQATNQATNQVGGVDSNLITADSVAMAIEMQTLEYRDSTYYARVVGPKIGTYCPRLDCIETYNRTRTIRETVTKRNRFAVTAGAGVAYTPDGIQPVVGVQIGVILWSF